jgi:site-specific recombinase XerD
MGHFVHYSSFMSTLLLTSTSERSTAMILLYDRLGNRKYMTQKEQAALLSAAAKSAPAQVQTFLNVLAYTGARLSEALAITPMRMDFVESVIILETLKKRRTGIFRAVPVPCRLLEELDRAHSVRQPQKTGHGCNARIWPWGRTTAWNRVKELMVEAGVSGPQARPKGLRHGFAVGAVQAGVSLNIVQRWLGHANLSTTAIYADAVGEEELSLAKRMWANF